MLLQCGFCLLNSGIARQEINFRMLNMNIIKIELNWLIDIVDFIVIALEKQYLCTITHDERCIGLNV